MSQAIDRALELLDSSDQRAAENDLAEAERLCGEALTIFEAEEGPESPDVANILHTLGGILEQRGSYDHAAACAARAAHIIEPLVPQFEGDDGRLILANALGLWGTALRQKGQYAEAEGPLRRALAVAEETAQPGMVVTALNNLGVLCKFWGRFEDGSRFYERALELARAMEPHSDILPTLLHNVGGLHHARGAFAEAVAPSREAWELRRAALGEDHPHTLADEVAYAAILDGLGRYTESRPIYERAVAAYQRIFGPEHYEVASTLHNLAALEAAEGNVARAEELYRGALAMKERLLGIEHPDTALTAGNLSGVLEDRGQPHEALELARQALMVMERTLEKDHPHVAAMRRHCAGLEDRIADPPKTTGENC